MSETYYHTSEVKIVVHDLLDDESSFAKSNNQILRRNIATENKDSQRSKFVATEERICFRCHDAILPGEWVTPGREGMVRHSGKCYDNFGEQLYPEDYVSEEQAYYDSKIARHHDRILPFPAK